MLGGIHNRRKNLSSSLVEQHPQRLQTHQRQQGEQQFEFHSIRRKQWWFLRPSNPQRSIRIKQTILKLSFKDWSRLIFWTLFILIFVYAVGCFMKGKPSTNMKTNQNQNNNLRSPSSPFSKLTAERLHSLRKRQSLNEFFGGPNLRYTHHDDDKFLEDKESDFPPLLIVGGSDGSGTRSFVSVLQQLDVTVLYDDPITFDLHCMGLFHQQGWPHLVTTVLNSTHSANYEYESLPNATKLYLRNQIRLLLQMIHRKQRITYLNQHLQSKNGARPIRAAAAPFAFKAPVTMLLLPILNKFFGRIKFLHVMRDGRDIALSNNQSPVMKFYNATYLDYQNRSELFSGELELVKAMQLWNDWNFQAYEWGTKHHGNTIDYLVLRSEDLVDPTKRLECLSELANFVGSNISQEELCCLSQQPIMDFGVSGKHGVVSNHSAKIQTTSPKQHSMKQQRQYKYSSNSNINNNSRDAFEQFEKDFEDWKVHVDQTNYGTLVDYQSLQQIIHVGHLLESTWINRFAKDTANLDPVSSDVHTEIKRCLQQLVFNAQQALFHPSVNFQETIRQRYGKWKIALSNQTKLSRLLHHHGATSLRLFGYEPYSYTLPFLEYRNNTLLLLNRTCPTTNSLCNNN